MMDLQRPVPRPPPTPSPARPLTLKLSWRPARWSEMYYTTGVMVRIAYVTG